MGLDEGVALSGLRQEGNQRWEAPHETDKAISHDQ